MSDRLKIQFNQLKTNSIEDAVRWAIRDQQKRKEFRDQYPMYVTAKVEAQLEQLDQEIELYEQQIEKATKMKRELRQTLRLCKQRDDALENLAQQRIENGRDTVEFEVPRVNGDAG
jgi:predicted RNase H-like nuclease (RuvC/YqgF family)